MFYFEWGGQQTHWAVCFQFCRAVMMGIRAWKRVTMDLEKWQRTNYHQCYVGYTVIVIRHVLFNFVIHVLY